MPLAQFGCIAMFLLLNDETWISCRYDEGRDLIVVDRRDMDENDCITCFSDGEDEVDVYDYFIHEETRRVYFIELDYDDDDESDSDSEYSLDDDESSDESGESDDGSSYSAGGDVDGGFDTDAYALSRAYGFQ